MTLSAMDHGPSTNKLPRRLRTVRLVPLLAGWLRALNQVETDGVAVCSAFDLDTAIAEQLEFLAVLVGVSPNAASTDDILRILVRSEIFTRKSRGVIDDLLGVLDALFPGADAPLTEFPPAAFEAGPVFSITTDLAMAAADQIDRAAPAGVGSRLIYSTEAESDTFQFASGDVVEIDTSAGYANDAGTTGGSYADVF